MRNPSLTHPDPAISRLTSHRLKRLLLFAVAGLRSVARKTTPHGHALPDDRSTAWTLSVHLFRTLSICSRAQIVVLRQMLSPHVGCRSMYVNGRSLPAAALLVCHPSRNFLSGRCSATVRCRPVCSCRSSRALSCCRHALSVCVSGSCAADGPCWGLVCGPCGVRASPCTSVYTYIHYIGLACQLSGPRPDRFFCFSNI